MCWIAWLCTAARKSRPGPPRTALSRRCAAIRILVERVARSNLSRLRNCRCGSEADGLGRVHTMWVDDRPSAAPLGQASQPQWVDQAERKAKDGVPHGL